MLTKVFRKADIEVFLLYLFIEQILLVEKENDCRGIKPPCAQDLKRRERKGATKKNHSFVSTKEEKRE